mmetsp:Transcript_21061/g.33016  ORF Transcript_21061/g.33016 Transcript_21061/m.33016 type:complete len:126 (+) Transcript_21061:899-1276(+)
MPEHEELKAPKGADCSEVPKAAEIPKGQGQGKEPQNPHGFDSLGSYGSAASGGQVELQVLDSGALTVPRITPSQVLRVEETCLDLEAAGVDGQHVAVGRERIESHGDEGSEMPRIPVDCEAHLEH